MAIIRESKNISNPEKWGLPKEAVGSLAERLRDIWMRFRKLFKTTTKDTSEHAYTYVRGLLTMDTKRNYANIACRVIGPSEDGQNIQQFISDSPWQADPVFTQIQYELKARHELQGGMLILDESGDERAGKSSAGASRQYLGRLGKIDIGQMGVVLSYFQGNCWTMLDAQLYLPEIWFTPEYVALHKRLHIPATRQFLTKQQIGLNMIINAKKNGVPFTVFGCDSYYGDDHDFRYKLCSNDVLYLADIRRHTKVYLTEPVVGIPEPSWNKRHHGPPFSRSRVLGDDKPVLVTNVLPLMQFRSIVIRDTERGVLEYQCAALRVWTVTADCIVHQEWLLARREHDGSYKFSLSNAPLDTSLEQLARWQCARYFVERTIEDAKSEAGWDELVARKYRAWMHHAALVALTLWFVALTKLEWEQQFPRDPDLNSELDVHSLPGLSMANIRELIKAVLPLKQLSSRQANFLVIKHLVGRTRSTSSRLKNYQRSQQFNGSP